MYRQTNVFLLKKLSIQGDYTYCDIKFLVSSFCDDKIPKDKRQHSKCYLLEWNDPLSIGKAVQTGVADLSLHCTGVVITLRKQPGFCSPSTAEVINKKPFFSL